MLRSRDCDFCLSNPPAMFLVIGTGGQAVRQFSMEEIMKVWSKPAVREQEVGLEVTSYLPAEIDIIYLKSSRSDFSGAGRCSVRGLHLRRRPQVKSSGARAFCRRGMRRQTAAPS